MILHDLLAFGCISFTGPLAGSDHDGQADLPSGPNGAKSGKFWTLFFVSTLRWVRQDHLGTSLDGAGAQFRIGFQPVVLSTARPLRKDQRTLLLRVEGETSRIVICPLLS
jgi:hypothetical protein